MLVLSRKVGEKILIGDDIVITVVDIGNSRLKVGIQAPSQHRILRSELTATNDRPGPAGPDAMPSLRTTIVNGRRPHSRRHAARGELTGA